MSDSDSSCGVVISGFSGSQPSVKMVKRDRLRDVSRRRDNHPYAEDSGDHTAMIHQRTTSQSMASERKDKSDRKTETRDHIKSTSQRRRATMDHYQPSTRINTIKNFAIPKSVEIDHIERNENPVEIKATEDNKTKRSLFSRRKTEPSCEGAYKSNQVDLRSGKNIDSMSRGNSRGGQSSSRNEQNKNSKRAIQVRSSDLVQEHQRPTSRDTIITRSSNTPRDPNIPSFLSIPANHESADDHEECEHDSYHRCEADLKDTVTQGSHNFSTSKTRSMESIGTTTVPSQALANSSPRNDIKKHLSPLMIAASELDTMRNQLELYLHQMNTCHDSEDSVVEVNILSPPTPLPHSSFPEQLLQMVRLLPGNDQCCDCGKEYLQEDKTEEMIRELAVKVDSAHIGGEGLSGTQQGEETAGSRKRLHSWASTSYGIILCNNCAYRHYNYSKKSDKNDRGGDIVKSLNGKNWTLPDVIAMLEGGNKSIVQYFSDSGSEKKNQQVVPTDSVNQRSGLLSNTWAVVNLGNDTQAMKEKNPDSNEDAFNCAFDVRYTSSVAVSYRKLMSKRILAFGSKWQIWM